MGWNKAVKLPPSLTSNRSGKAKPAGSSMCGEPKSVDKKNKSTKEENGTLITFLPDGAMFKKYRFRNEHWNACCATTRT